MTDRGLDRFSVSSEKISGGKSLRLDASFYNREVGFALSALEATGMNSTPLGDITERVFIPTRFKRTYVASEHGIPFLQGSHIVQFQPADLKYLSTAAHKKLQPYLIHRGWLLLTRSGTTGRVAIVPPEWDGWAASEHIFRIVPKVGGVPVGYIATFLSSAIGQAQLSAQVYGAVVDELTEDQVRSILVPVAVTASQKAAVKAIDELTEQAVKSRSEAIRALEGADRAMAKLVPPPEPPETSDEYDRFRQLAGMLVQVPKDEIAGR